MYELKAPSGLLLHSDKTRWWAILNSTTGRKGVRHDRRRVGRVRFRRRHAPRATITLNDHDLRLLSAAHSRAYAPVHTGNGPAGPRRAMHPHGLAQSGNRPGEQGTPGGALRPGAHQRILPSPRDAFQHRQFIHSVDGWEAEVRSVRSHLDVRVVRISDAVGMRGEPAAQVHELV